MSEWCECGDDNLADSCSTCGYALHGNQQERDQHRRLCTEVEIRTYGRIRPLERRGPYMRSEGAK